VGKIFKTMDKINKLRSYLGQLQDLEAGHLKELIISAGEDSQLLKKILVNAIEDEQAFLTMNEDIDRKEAEAIRDEELLEEIRREKIEDEEYARKADWDILNEKNRDKLSHA